ncbi:MAG TPA: plastocyanin/azurin family copper-binding protein [Opitutaceae bacterium]|jgi:azurin
MSLPVLAALLAVGCSKSANTSSTAAAPSGPREIDLTAGDTMKFNITQIDAKPGEALKVVLTNVGTQPITVMGHNWVLLKAGTDVAAFDAAGLQSKDTGYIPANLSSEMIAHIDLQGPRKSGEADFNAPTTPGDYPFLCTFPAHYQAGMKGTLTVK